jgi:PAS domain S-box-containing protein
LYQVNPHYVLLCTLDGRIVEANPAFYAVTGMPPEAVRNGRVGVLADVFPVEPLMDLARRSLDEGAAIGGIDYGIVGADDEARPVEVSVRAFQAGTTELVVIQATDVAARRRLERRVEAFSDTLDLMVDERVARLTAGQQSLRRILDAAGVAVASFDAGGGTRRWSGGARALTGRTAADVPHFTSVTAALGLTDADRAAFTAWFWNPGDAPLLVRHALADAATGRLRSLQVVWHKVEADVPGRTDARTVVGAPVPATDDVGAALGLDAQFVGDGLAGEVPSSPVLGRP